MNTPRVNAAVKIRIARERADKSCQKAMKKINELNAALKRLVDGMAETEWHEYQKRIFQ